METPRKFIIAELSIRKLGSSSVLIILLALLALKEKNDTIQNKMMMIFSIQNDTLIVLLALMKIRAYGSKALQ